MDEKIVQLTESSLGRKLVPDAPVYPIVLDRSVLVMDNDENKYVPLDTLDLIGFMKLSEYFSKFIPFNQYVISILQTSGTYEGATKGEVIYCTTKNVMLLKLIEHDNVLGDVAKYYTQWTGEQSILGYSSDEYNSNGTIKTSRFFYTVDTGLTFYKYSNDLHLLVPTATGSESIEPGYIEQVIDNIFNSYINTAAHIKPINYWIDNDMELPDFMAVEEGSYAYWEGHGLYIRLEELMDWDLVATDTIGQFFYYDNALYEWDGTNLMPVIDTVAITTALRSEFNTIIENENQYIKTLNTWHHLYAYYPNSMYDFHLDAPDGLYVYSNRHMYHSEDGSWFIMNNQNDSSIDYHYFYDTKHLFQYRNHNLYVIFDFNAVIQSVMPDYIDSVMKDSTKTINGKSIWKSEEDSNDFVIPSTDYIGSLISKDIFDPNSDNPASQKIINYFFTSLLQKQNGQLLVPDYCCTQEELPLLLLTDKIWFDTAYNKLYKITSGRNYINYLDVSDAIILCVKKTSGGVDEYIPMLYVQTGQSTSIAINLANGGGAGNSNSLIVYTPIWKNSDTANTGIRVGDTFFNQDTKELYIQESSTTTRQITSGTYLLIQGGITINYYLYKAESMNLVPIGVIDTELNIASLNPVQNKAVTTALQYLELLRSGVIQVYWSETEPENYSFWYNPNDGILYKKENFGGIKQVIALDGKYLFTVIDGDSKLYLYTPGRNKTVQIVDQSILSKFRMDIKNDIWDSILEDTGSVIPVAYWNSTDDRDEWDDAEFFYNSSTKMLYIMYSDGTKQIVGKDGTPRLLYYNNVLYYWKYRSVPVPLLNYYDGQTYADKEEFFSWKSCVISVDYIQVDTPTNPDSNSVWYNPSSGLSVYSGGIWNTVEGITFNANEKYVLFNKSDNCLYIVQSSESQQRYVPDAIQDIYVNGVLVNQSEDGRNVARISVSNAGGSVASAAGVITPYWGDLDDEGVTFNEGDYCLTTTNQLYIFEYIEIADENVPREITSGSYLLRKVETDEQTNETTESLYLFTVGNVPVKYATLADVSGASGGAILKLICGGSNYSPNGNGEVTLPDFVTQQELGTRLSTLNTSLSTTINGVQLLAGMARKQGKVAHVSYGDVVSSYGSYWTTSSYQSGDSVSLVISSEGQLFVRHIHSTTSTYYLSWADNPNIPLVASSYYNHDDLYFSTDEGKLVFYIWDEDASKYVAAEGIDFIQEVIDDALAGLTKTVDVIAKDGDIVQREWNTSDLGLYVLYHNGTNPILGRYAGQVDSQPTFTPVDAGVLYLAYYNGHMYAYKRSGIQDVINTLVEFPSASDYESLRNSIPEKVLVVKHFGSSSVVTGITWVNGDLWYDSSDGVKRLKKYNGSSFVNYNSSVPLILFNNTENENYKRGMYAYIQGDGVYGSGTASNNSGSNVVVIKYVQPNDGMQNPSNGDYWYNPTNNILSVKRSESWTTVTTSVSQLYVSPTPDSINDAQYKAYGNIIYRGNGVNGLIPLSNDDELTNTLVNLAETLQQQSASLSNIVATAGSSFPTRAIIGQCYFRTDVHKPYWYAGQGIGWVDANGDSYNS